MNRKFVALAGVAVAGLGVASTAWAGHVKMTDATGYLNGTDGSGGAFIVNRDSGDVGRLGDLGLTASTGTYGNGSFYTFCLERTEHISFGATYYTQISGGAVNGGYSGQTSTNYDPVSNETAALYRTFRSGGSFGGTIGTIDQSAETTALQVAIWYFEGEWFDLGNGNPLALSAQAQELVNWATANATGLGGVRVLTLWTNYNASTGTYSGNSQDMLTIIPLPPAAYAGIGSLLGVVGFGVIRRRRLRAE